MRKFGIGLVGCGTIMINQPWWDATQPLYELYSLEHQAEPPRWESPGLDEVQASFNYYQDVARASMIAHLADCIQQDSQPVVSGEHAVHVLEIMLKALQSAREGRSLELETTFRSIPAHKAPLRGFLTLETPIEV